MAELRNRKQHIIGAKIRVFYVRHELCPLSEEAEAGGYGVVELEKVQFVSHPLDFVE